MGLDSKGRPYVGGQTVIWRADSLAALSAKAKPWYGWATVGGNINDLQLDAKDVVHVARNNGTIWRVDPAQSQLKPEQLHPWGDEASIAVHPKTQNVWAIQRNKGKLVEIHRGTLVITTRAHWAKAGVVRTNRIAWHPTDGRLYATSFVKPKGGYVLRWDPAKPQKLETWISGLNEKKAPDGVAWNAAGTCLYYTAPLSGTVNAVCKCP